MLVCFRVELKQLPLHFCKQLSFLPFNSIQYFDDDRINDGDREEGKDQGEQHVFPPITSAVANRRLDPCLVKPTAAVPKNERDVANAVHRYQHVHQHQNAHLWA